MRFGSGGVTKLERANLLLLALASLLVRGGERVGFLGAPYLPGASRLALTAHRPCPARSAFRRQSAPALPPEPAAASRRGAQLVWLSDFLEPGAEERDASALPAPASVGHLVRIVDPAEEDFPYPGRTRFESPKGRDSDLFGRAESVGAAYRARFTAHGESDRARRHQAGLDLHRASHRSSRRRRR